MAKVNNRLAALLWTPPGVLEGLYGGDWWVEVEWGDDVSMMGLSALRLDGRQYSEMEYADAIQAALECPPRTPTK